MDLIGDYAGKELFVIDGDSLVQRVLSDPLLALAKPEGLHEFTTYLTTLILTRFW